MDGFACQPFTKTIALRHGGDAHVVRMKVSLPQFMGMTPSEYGGNDNVQALVSASPAQETFFHIVTCPSDFSSTVVGVTYLRVIYDIEFFNRFDTAIDLPGHISRLEHLLASREQYLAEHPSKLKRSRPPVFIEQKVKSESKERKR
jgi:hypothetical protein